MKAKVDLYTLKQILLNKFDHDRRLAGIQSGRLSEIMNTPQKDQSATQQIQEEIFKTLSAVMAERLIRNDHSVPLFSAEDLDQVIVEYVSREIGFDEMIDFYDGRSEAIKVIKSMMSSFFDLALGIVGGVDQYDRYWRMVNVIVKLAGDESISLVLPIGDDRYDEVTRRLFTKDEYLTQTKLIFSALSDPEKLIHTIIDPILNSMDMDKFERADVEKDLREQVMPQLKPQIEKTMSALHLLTIEEVERLYH